MYRCLINFGDLLDSVSSCVAIVFDIVQFVLFLDILCVLYVLCWLSCDLFFVA